MRGTILIPAAILIAAACGWVVCLAGGWNIHPKEMALAAVAGAIAAVAALVPPYLVRGTDQAGIAQAALAGTVLHMLLCLGLAGVAVLTGLAADTTAFALWMLAFYWASLAAVAASVIPAIRSAGRTRAANAGGANSNSTR